MMNKNDLRTIGKEEQPVKVTLIPKIRDVIRKEHLTYAEMAKEAQVSVYEIRRELGILV